MQTTRTYIQTRLTKFHTAAEDTVKSLIQRNKRLYFKQFCDKLSASDFSKASNKLKNIKRSKTTLFGNVFQHIDGPQAAVDAITASWQDTYDGKHINPAIAHIPVAMPYSEGFTTTMLFDIEDVKYAIKCLLTD